MSTGYVRSVHRGWVYGHGTHRRRSLPECALETCTHPGAMLTYAHTAAALCNAFALHSGLPIEMYPLFVQVVNVPVHFLTIHLANRSHQ